MISDKEPVKTIDEMKRETDLPVVIADREGYITYVNETFQLVFGWTSDEILGKTSCNFSTIRENTNDLRQRTRENNLRLAGCDRRSRRLHYSETFQLVFGWTSRDPWL